jgi:hypothetical protein
VAECGGCWESGPAARVGGGLLQAAGPGRGRSHGRTGGATWNQVASETVPGILPGTVFLARYLKQFFLALRLYREIPAITHAPHASPIEKRRKHRKWGPDTSADLTVRRVAESTKNRLRNQSPKLPALASDTLLVGRASVACDTL